MRPGFCSKPGMFRLLFLLALLLPLVAGAAPITVKEIDFLLRQRTPEPDIANQIKARRLPEPLDAASEKLLRDHGASAGLIALLKQESTVLSASEAQSYLNRKAPLQSAPLPTPKTGPATSPVMPIAPGAPVAPAPTPAPAPRQAMPGGMEQLTGKLVHLDGGDELKPFDVQQLRNIRVYAIFCAAMWSGPCRQFAPKLVEYYKATKAKHPDFEIIFLSGDRDEFNMATFMRTSKMPFPALRYGTQSEMQKLYVGDTVPWLVCVASNGQPLTSNGVDRKYIEPTEIMGAIDYLLSQPK
jgi:thiol-disulfide isomerase/thioredoxin